MRENINLIEHFLRIINNPKEHDYFAIVDADFSFTNIVGQPVNAVDFLFSIKHLSATMHIEKVQGHYIKDDQYEVTFIIKIFDTLKNIHRVVDCNGFFTVTGQKIMSFTIKYHLDAADFAWLVSYKKDILKTAANLEKG